MPAARKRTMILYLSLFGAALVLIAASLPGLVLQPGVPLPYMSSGEIYVPNEPGEAPVHYEVNDFMVGVLVVLLGVSLIWMIYRGMQGIGWKALARDVLHFSAVILGAAALLAIILLLLPGEPAPASEDLLVIPTPPAVVNTPLGPPPAILTWLVGAVLAVSAALLGVWFWRSRPASNQALLRLGQEAAKARQALLTGMSLRDVILQCYRQMSSVLQEEHGIQRQDFMTTGEFERLLAEQGFPAEPVHQLTRLFEAVRYGRWQPGLSDDQKAIDCLEAIVQYSQETRRADGEQQAEEHA